MKSSFGGLMNIASMHAKSYFGLFGVVMDKKI